MKNVLLRIAILLALAAVLPVPDGFAAITLLNGTNIQSGYSFEEANDDNDFSCSVSIPAGTTFALVGVTNRYHRKPSGTLGGVTLVEMVDREGDDQRAAFLYAKNPPSGSQTLSLTFSGDAAQKTVGIYCFSGVDLDTPAMAAYGTYATDPSVTFAAAEAPSSSVVVTLVSTKDEIDVASEAVMTGGGTKQLGYRRWPRSGTWLFYEYNGAAMGIVTGLSGVSTAAGWDIPGAGTMAAVSLRLANTTPTDIAPNTLTVNDNDPTDTVVGTLTVTDPDGVAPYAWTLVNSAFGRFKLSASTGTTVNVLIDSASLIDRGVAASHTIDVRVDDAATYNGYYQETLTVNVLDTTKPAFSDLTHSMNYARTGDVVTFTITVTENVALNGNPTMTVNGVSLGAPTNVAGSVYTYSYPVPAGVTEGAAAVAVSAVDTSGNANSASYTSGLILDNTAPTIGSVVPNPAAVQPGETLHIEVAASDLNGLSMAPRVWVEAEFLGNPVSTMGNIYTYEYTVPSSQPDGRLDIIASAVDRAGNGRTVNVPDAILVDGSAPAISNLSCNLTPVRPGTTVLFSVTATDANGLSGNPIIRVNGVNIGGADAVVGDIYQYFYTLSPFEAEGPCTVEVTAEDIVGNTTVTTSTSILRVDNTPPSITNFAANPAIVRAGTLVSLSVNVSDLSALTGPPAMTLNSMALGAPTVADTLYTWSYVIAASIPDGMVLLQVTATDAAGNVGTAYSNTTLRVDNTGPMITDITTTPALVTVNQAVSIQFRAFDIGCGLAGAPTVLVNGANLGAPLSYSGGLYTYQYTVPATPVEGPATVSISAVDMLGNTASSTPANLFSIDASPPQVTGMQVNPNVAKDGDAIRLTFIATDAFSDVQPNPVVTLNGNATTFYQKVGATYEYRYTLDAFVDPDGDAPIAVIAQDLVGNAATFHFSGLLLIDSSVPTASGLSVFPSFAKDGDTVVISFSINDDIGLSASPTVKVNGHDSIYNDSSGDYFEYVYNVDTPSDPEGPATITITATDVLNNTGASTSSGLLVVDSIPPAGTLSIAGGVPFTRTPYVTLTVTASDGALGSGVEHMRFSDDYALWSVWQTYAATRSWELPGDQGYKDVYVQFRDRAGNVSNVPITDRIALAPNPLTVKVDGDDMKSVTEGDTVLLEVTVSNAFGATTYEWVKIAGPGALDPDGLPQGPVLSLDTVDASDAGTYICMVSDELMTVDSPPIEVQIQVRVPVGAHALWLAALAVSIAGAWTLTRRRGRAVALVLAAAMILGCGGAAFAAPQQQYTLVYSAHASGKDLSDEDLTALALEKGSCESLTDTADGKLLRKLLRLGDPGVGNPGFTSTHRQELEKKIEEGLKASPAKDGRDEYVVDYPGKCTVTYRAPKNTGKQTFEVFVNDLKGVRRMSERRIEETVDGTLRPKFIRVDHEGGAIAQVFQRVSTLPEFPAITSNPTYQQVDFKPQAIATESDFKSGETQSRQVQFTVPPQGLENIGFDSGWVPGGDGPDPGGFIIQVHLKATAGFNYDANVSGYFSLSDTNLITAGNAMGNWGFYFGAEFLLKAAFDIPLSFIDPFVVDIPYVPDFYMVASQRDNFNSYLLDSVSHLRSEAGRQQIVKLDLIELLITRGVISLPDWVPLPEAGIQVDAMAVAEGHVGCTNITFTDGTVFTQEHEGKRVTVPPEGYRVGLTYNTDAQLDLGAKVFPQIFFGILGWNWEWPGEDEDIFLTRLEWLPIHLTSFPFSKAELNFTGQPSTGTPTDWFTQNFDMANINIAHKRVLFTPNFSNNYYVACIENATGYRTNPYDGTILTLPDDGYAAVTLQNGKKVSLYGQQYSTVYVGSNGYVTFTQPDSSDEIGYDHHFATPRVSGLLYDLNPNLGGKVYVKQHTNRLVITWDKVPTDEVVTSYTVSFQIELFFDGRIVITWNRLDLYTGLVGLSRGGGKPANFQKSVFVNYPTCLDAIPEEGAVRVTFQPPQLLTTTARWRLDGKEWRESGETEAAIVGVHTLEFNTTPGWAPPLSHSISITKDYQLELEERWTRQKGLVELRVTPELGAWEVIDGDGVAHTGMGSAVLYDIPTGQLRATWQPLATYTLPIPNPALITLYPSSRAIFSGYYQPIYGQGIGSLTITLEPETARMYGAQWRVGESGAWNDSGTTLQLPDTTALIHFKTVPGWVAPADAPLSVIRDRAFEYTYTYQRQRGTVVINVDPEGAPWAVIDADGLPRTGMGDATLEGIPAGMVHVIWGYIPSYTTPQPNPYSEALSADGTLVFTGSYMPAIGEGQGILSVTLKPDVLVRAGAQWRIVGNEWHDSGAMIATEDGAKTIYFKQYGGWISPPPANVTVVRNISNAFTYQYVRETGTVVIHTSSPYAPWRLVDGNNITHTGTGSATLLNIPTGPEVLYWDELEGYALPVPHMGVKTLTAGGTVQFDGEYVEAMVVADFSATPQLGTAPLEVHFNDTSISTAKPLTEWHWYFGDGESSTGRNPVHTYTASGNYTVTLTVTNYEEIKMITKKHYIAVGAELPAAVLAGLAAMTLALAYLGAAAKRRHSR